jgi:DNA-binding response OmpR family regulator
MSKGCLERNRIGMDEGKREEMTAIRNPKSAIRNGLTPTQQQILERLPATPDELAQALYGRVTRYERRLIYVHIALLRRRLNGTARILSRRRKTGSDADGSTCRVIYELDPCQPPAISPQPSAANPQQVAES